MFLNLVLLTLYNYQLPRGQRFPAEHIMNKNNIDKKKAFIKLNQLYSKIPETEGCIKNLNLPKEESCNGWCCCFQNPQLLYVEFLNTWNYVLNNWSLDEIAGLIESAINNYLTDIVSKSCIFWDRETKLCKQHETRPYNCRIYSITPEEEFKPRYERLKVLHQGKFGAVIRDQCDLVSTKDGSEVTTQMTDDWWNELVEVEKFIGIKPNEINDDMGGTYRTYHDHLLLHICPDSVLERLQDLRLYGTPLEKKAAVKGLMAHFEKKLSDLAKNNG